MNAMLAALVECFAGDSFARGVDALVCGKIKLRKILSGRGRKHATNETNQRQNSHKWSHHGELKSVRFGSFNGVWDWARKNFREFTNRALLPEPSFPARRE